LGLSCSGSTLPHHSSIADETYTCHQLPSLDSELPCATVCPTFPLRLVISYSGFEIPNSSPNLLLAIIFLISVEDDFRLPGHNLWHYSHKFKTQYTRRLLLAPPSNQVQNPASSHHHLCLQVLLTLPPNSPSLSSS
jgi:hypothetical protein